MFIELEQQIVKFTGRWPQIEKNMLSRYLWNCIFTCGLYDEVNNFQQSPTFSAIAILKGGLSFYFPSKSYVSDIYRLHSFPCNFYNSCSWIFVKVPPLTVTRNQKYLNILKRKPTG